MIESPHQKLTRYLGRVGYVEPIVSAMRNRIYHNFPSFLEPCLEMTDWAVEWGESPLFIGLACAMMMDPGSVRRTIRSACHDELADSIIEAYEFDVHARPPATKAEEAKLRFVLDLELAYLFMPSSQQYLRCIRREFCDEVAFQRYVTSSAALCAANGRHFQAEACVAPPYKPFYLLAEPFGLRCAEFLLEKDRDQRDVVLVTGERLPLDCAQQSTCVPSETFNLRDQFCLPDSVLVGVNASMTGNWLGIGVIPVVKAVRSIVTDLRTHIATVHGDAVDPSEFKVRVAIGPHVTSEMSEDVLEQALGELGVESVSSDGVTGMERWFMITFRERQG